HGDRAKSTVREAVVLERNRGLELRALYELLIARITARAGADIGDASDLLLHQSITRPNDPVGSDPEAQRWQVRVLGAAGPHVGDLRGKDIRRIAVHQVGIALSRDQVLRRRGLAPGVEHRPGS